MNAFHVRGAAIVYRLYDVGYEIRLDDVLDRLASSAPERLRPVRGEAQAIQIPNPPITVILGQERVTLGGGLAGRTCDAEVSARIFDFGVVSLRLHFDLDEALAWEEFVAFGNAIDTGTDLTPVFEHHRRLLLDRIRPAVERPVVAEPMEDYVVYRVSAMTSAEGTRCDPRNLRDEDVVLLLLNESRPLSPSARAELLPHRFSYYEDDLAILTWNNALIIDLSSEDTDIQYVLEFANAQLLELRYYDGMLDAELPRMYDRITAARSGGQRTLLRRRYAPLLGELQRQVAESTEIVERAENSLKVTDDVYLARIYSAALGIFRAQAWRASLDRKLGIIRGTYAMLNAEAQAVRTELLELAIVLLIVLEIVIPFVLRR